MMGLVLCHKWQKTYVMLCLPPQPFRGHFLRNYDVLQLGILDLDWQRAISSVFGKIKGSLSRCRGGSMELHKADSFTGNED